MQRIYLPLLLASIALMSGCMDGQRITGETSQKATPSSAPSLSESPTVQVECDKTSIYVGESTPCRAYYFPFANMPGHDVTSYATFSSFNPSIVSMSGSTATGVAAGYTYVRADYEGDMAFTRVEVSNPPAPDPLNVNGIRGPSRVNPMDTCEWYVSFGGGVAPYTFEWGGLATGHTEGSVIMQPAYSGAFDVIVRDATGAARYASFYVEVTSDQLPGCY